MIKHQNDRQLVNCKYAFVRCGTCNSETDQHIRTCDRRDLKIEIKPPEKYDIGNVNEFGPKRLVIPEAFDPNKGANYCSSL